MSIQAINVRNQFKGKVREIIRGDVVALVKSTEVSIAKL